MKTDLLHISPRFVVHPQLIDLARLCGEELPSTLGRVIMLALAVNEKHCAIFTPQLIDALVGFRGFETFAHHLACVGWAKRNTNNRVQLRLPTELKVLNVRQLAGKRSVEGRKRGPDGRLLPRGPIPKPKPQRCRQVRLDGQGNVIGGEG